MTKLEALAKANQIRQEKLLKRLYEQNKALINKDHSVTFDMWKRRIEKSMVDNPRYKDINTLVRAGRKMLHTTEYMSKEELGIENIKQGLKTMKTGNVMKWGKGTKEETMYDLFKRTVGVGKKQEMFWSEETKTYHFIGADNLEYEVVVKTSPKLYIVQAVNS